MAYACCHTVITTRFLNLLLQRCSCKGARGCWHAYFRGPSPLSVLRTLSVACRSALVCSRPVAVLSTFCRPLPSPTTSQTTCVLCSSLTHLHVLGDLHKLKGWLLDCGWLDGALELRNSASVGDAGLECLWRHNTGTAPRKPPNPSSVSKRLAVSLDIACVPSIWLLQRLDGLVRGIRAASTLHNTLQLALSSC